eukprot:3566857-Rhodomonas_salina.2
MHSNRLWHYAAIFRAAYQPTVGQYCARGCSTTVRLGQYRTRPSARAGSYARVPQADTSAFGLPGTPHTARRGWRVVAEEEKKGGRPDLGRRKEEDVEVAAAFVGELHGPGVVVKGEEARVLEPAWRESESESEKESQRQETETKAEPAVLAPAWPHKTAPRQGLRRVP